MKKIKIFLGSSITEFEKERNELELFIRNLSDRFEDDYNIKIVPLRCENMDNHLRVGGTQNTINEELVRESDMCFFIFFTKVGEFTEEEFRVAFEKYTNEGKPKIYIYFKNISDDVSVEASVKKFMEKIDYELRHYHGTFDHIDTVKLRILLNLKIQEMEFVSVKVEQGKVLVDGQEALGLKNVSEYANSVSLKQLTNELQSIEEEYLQLKSICSGAEVENSFFKRYAEVASRRQNLMDLIEELEKNIFKVSLQLCKDEVHGEITHRQKEAYRLFELGDYTGCLAVLDQEEINKGFYHFEKRELEKISKRASVFIREHYTAIKVLELMFDYNDRISQIADRYNTIIPVIKKYLVELEIWLDYVCYLYAESDYEKCFDEIKQIIKLDYKSKLEANSLEFEKRLKSVLFGVVHKMLVSSDKENLIAFTEELESLMKSNKWIIAPYLQMCYAEIGIKTDFFTDDPEQREQASMYFQKAVDIVSEVETEQTLAFAEKYKRYVTDRYRFHTKDINYPRFVHRESVSCRVDDSTLYIYGEGAMKDYLITYGSEDDDEAPWSEISGIKRIVVEEGVQYIGDFAFAYNKEVEEVVISSTVCDIGIHVFSGCDNLRNIYVRPNNKFYRSVDGVLYDYSCRELVFVPNKLVVFSFEVPKSVTTIGRQAFAYNHNLVEISLSNTIMSIGPGAFERCDHLRKITLSNGISVIQSQLFRGCEKLVEIILPETISDVGAAAFLDCSFEWFELIGPDKVLHHTFANCTKLKKMVLGEGIKEVHYYAFANCAELQEIHLPKSLRYVDSKAFEWCFNLKTIIFNGNRDEWEKKSFSKMFPESKYIIEFLAKV